MKRASLAIVAGVLFLVSSGVICDPIVTDWTVSLAQGGTVSILFPSGSQRAYGPWPVVSEADARVEAYDPALREGTISVTFEYSSDSTQWTLIGTDTDPGYEPPLPPEPVPEVVPGYSGWNVFWNTTGLTEGKYTIRATMSYAAGPPAEGVQEVYFTPTPPGPQIVSPTFLRTVSGKFPVSAVCASPSIQSMQVDILIGSDKKHEQKGFKDFSGANDLWPAGYCTPAAVAQAIWRLAGKNPNLLNAGDDVKAEVEEGIKKYKLGDRFGMDDFVQDGKLTFKGLMLVMAVKMKTTEPKGASKGGSTSTGDIKTGIDQLLKEQGLNCTKEKGYEVKRTFKPTFKQYADELNRGESVVINWGEWKGAGKDGKEGTEDDKFEGNHSMTGKSSTVDPEGKNNGASFVESSNGTDTGDMKWKDGDKDAGGFSTVYFEDESGHIFGQEQIIDMVTISPKPKAPENIPKDTGSWVPKGTDHSGDDGWAVLCDCSDIPDGFYVVRAIMTDAVGIWGQDFTIVHISGKGPVGGVAELPDSAVVGGGNCGLWTAVMAAVAGFGLTWYALRRRARTQLRP